MRFHDFPEWLEQCKSTRGTVPKEADTGPILIIPICSNCLAKCKFRTSREWYSPEPHTPTVRKREQRFALRVWACACTSARQRKTMLWTICVILLVLWALGMATSYTASGLIHILLVIAVVVMLIRLFQGRRV